MQRCCSRRKTARWCQWRWRTDCLQIGVRRRPVQWGREARRRAAGALIHLRLHLPRPSDLATQDWQCRHRLQQQKRRQKQHWRKKMAGEWRVQLKTTMKKTTMTPRPPSAAVPWNYWEVACPNTAAAAAAAAAADAAAERRWRRPPTLREGRYRWQGRPHETHHSPHLPHLRQQQIQRQVQRQSQLEARGSPLRPPARILVTHYPPSRFPYERGAGWA